MPRGQQTEAAIRAFDLYKDYPWATAVFHPFTATHASQIVVNTAWFSGVHQTWTIRVIADFAPRLPTLVLRELQRLMEVDATGPKDSPKHSRPQRQPGPFPRPRCC